MAVDEGVEDYGAASANTPAGGDNIGTDLDDHLRDIKKNIRFLGQQFKNVTSPSQFLGRFWLNSSATATDKILPLSMSDGAAWIPFAYFNISANTAYSPANPADFASTGTTLTAGVGMSGGGTLAANRTLSVANTGLTATTAFTNAHITLDPYGRVISASSGATPSGPATAAEMQSGTATAVYASPAFIHHSPGMAKFWVAFDGSGTASITGSFNVDTVVRSAAGLYTINLTTGFTDANYSVGGSTLQVSGVNRAFGPRALATGSCQVGVQNGSAALVDGDKIYVFGFGYHTT